MKKSSTPYIICASVCLFNSWTLSIFKYNFLIGIILVLSTLLTLKLIINKGLDIKLRLLLFGLYLIILIFLFVNSFDINLFKTTHMQSDIIARRREYYSIEFNKLYRNRIGVFYSNQFRPLVNKYISNIAFIFDTDTYYFVNSSKTLQHSRFWPPMIIFFIYGFYFFLKDIDKKTFVLISLLIVLMGFTNTNNALGPISLYPFLCSLTAFGIYKLLKIKK